MPYAIEKDHEILWGPPKWLSGKESACQCRRHRRCRFGPWVRKMPWRRKWQPTRVFLPEKKIPWTEEPGGVQSMGSKRVRHNWALSIGGSDMVGSGVIRMSQRGRRWFSFSLKCVWQRVKQRMMQAEAGKSWWWRCDGWMSRRRGSRQRWGPRAGLAMKGWALGFQPECSGQLLKRWSAEWEAARPVFFRGDSALWERGSAHMCTWGCISNPVCAWGFQPRGIFWKSHGRRSLVGCSPWGR